MSLPEKTFFPGWPQELEDADGTEYWRLRDGFAHGEHAGDEVIYGRILDLSGEKPLVSGTEYFFVDAGSLMRDPDKLLMRPQGWQATTVFGTPLEDTFTVDPDV
jgi:hypothetical protein